MQSTASLFPASKGITSDNIQLSDPISEPKKLRRKSWPDGFPPDACPVPQAEVVSVLIEELHTDGRHIGGRPLGGPRSLMGKPRSNYGQSLRIKGKWCGFGHRAFSRLLIRWAYLFCSSRRQSGSGNSNTFGQLEHIERARETLLALLRPTQQRSHVSFELAGRPHVHGLHRPSHNCGRLRIGGRRRGLGHRVGPGYRWAS
jgi:hypothetical protein